MAALVSSKRRVSTGKALAFWPLLGLTMLIMTHGLGSLIERAVDSASSMVEQRAHLFENVRF